MESRHSMGVEQWQETLKKIGITYGEEINPYMSEVEYRKRVVDCVIRMLQTSNGTVVSATPGMTSRSQSYIGEVMQSSIVVHTLTSFTVFFTLSEGNSVSLDIDLSVF